MIAAQRPILVLGCGSIGRRHLKNLQTLGYINIAVFDPNPNQLGFLPQENRPKYFSDFDEAFKVHQPELVVVASPNSLHVPQALQAARRGAHLFIEKPLGSEATGITDLLKTVAEKKLMTLVGCNMRFHPLLLRVKELLDQGSLGKVYSFRAEVGQYLPDWHPWEDYRKGYSARKDLGGGIILDAIHEIDYLRWLMSPHQIQEVSATFAKVSNLEISTEDMAEITIVASDHVFCQIHMDYLQRSYARGLKIIGELGAIAVDFPTRTLIHTNVVAEKSLQKTLPEDWNSNEMYIEEMRHLMTCIDQKKPSQHQDVSQGWEALKIAFAAKESWSKRQWITL